MKVLVKNWFLVGLVVLIPLAIVTGWQGDQLQPLTQTVNMIPTKWCTAAILFFMSLTLNSGRLFAAMKAPLPVAVASGTNQIVIPLLCLPLLLLPWSPDIAVGLMIAASVPCTMAAASVWTRKAEGNDAVSLLVTLLTNGTCFLVAPAWLWVGHQWFGLVDTSGGLQFRDLVVRLVLTALVPAILGQTLRLHGRLTDTVDRNKRIISTVAQSIILTLVFVSAFRGGRQFSGGQLSENLRHTEFLLVWLCCVSLHLVAMWIAWKAAVRLKVAEADARACVIAGSQKTLPIGIVLSDASGMPFSILPMLMFHASQMFIDTAVAAKLKARNTTTKDSNSAE
ncbi:MAG: bile acid:sodium symporter [Fuerstiella sp.]